MDTLVTAVQELKTDGHTHFADGTVLRIVDLLPAELGNLIRQAQSHMLRTPEADAISVKLTHCLLRAGI